VEALTFIGGPGSVGVGNGLANLIVGGGNDTLDGGAGADTLSESAGANTYVFHAGEANGDLISEFVGAVAGGGDRLEFVGFGAAAAGAGFVRLNATDWAIVPAGGGAAEVIHFGNAALAVPADWRFS
jgi:Ca2+-binding RTX toxin-like protein